MICTENDPVKVWKSVALLGWALHLRYISELSNPSSVPQLTEALFDGCDSDFDFKQVVRDNIEDRLNHLGNRLRELDDFMLEYEISEPQARDCTPFTLDLHVYHLDRVPLIWYRLDKTANSRVCFEDMPISDLSFRVDDAHVLFDLFMAITVASDDDKGQLHSSRFEVGCLMARDRVLNAAIAPPPARPVGRPKGKTSAMSRETLEELVRLANSMYVEVGSKNGAAGAAIERMRIIRVAPQKSTGHPLEYSTSSSDFQSLKNLIAKRMDS